MDFINRLIENQYLLEDKLISTSVIYEGSLIGRLFESFARLNNKANPPRMLSTKRRSNLRKAKLIRGNRNSVLNFSEENKTEIIKNIMIISDWLSRNAVQAHPNNKRRNEIAIIVCFSLKNLDLYGMARCQI